ncbi:MAG: DUF5681 domain-containing protein [Candidatus Hodarchaeales archaeon]
MAARRKKSTARRTAKKGMHSPKQQGEKSAARAAKSADDAAEKVDVKLRSAQTAESEVIDAVPLFTVDPADPKFVFMVKSGKRVTRAFAEQIFRPGTTGNPMGRPKKRKLGTVFAEVLARSLTPRQRRAIEKKLGGGKIEDFEEGDPTRMEALCVLIVERALRGSFEAFREIGDRVDPKPRRLEVSGRDGAPVAAAVIARGMSNEEASDAYQSLIDGAPEAAESG